MGVVSGDLTSGCGLCIVFTRDLESKEVRLEVK